MIDEDIIDLWLTCLAIFPQNYYYSMQSFLQQNQFLSIFIQKSPICSTNKTQMWLIYHQ